MSRAASGLSVNLLLAAGAVLALGLGGCASSAQDPFAGAGDPAAVRAALAKSLPTGRGPINASGKPMVFVATDAAAGKPQIIAFDLEGVRDVWRAPASPVSRIAVGRTIIVYAQQDPANKEGTLVAREVSTGTVRWRAGLAASESRVGFAVDGDDVYEITQLAGGRGASRVCTLIAIDGHSGSARYRVQMAGEAGAPAARGGVVAILRRSQYVTLVDGATGKVLANILSREEAASFVKALPEGLFFGSRGIFQAGAETALGAHTPGHYFQAVLPAFVRPVYHWDMYRAGEADYSAVDRNGILWRVAEGAFADNTVVVHNFRFLFGIDAQAGSLRWAYNHPRNDLMASAHTGSAIVFVASDGSVGAVDARTGGRTLTAKIEDAGGAALMVRGATFDADGFAPAGGSPPAAPLQETLGSIAWDPDSRFLDVKVFALEELAKLPGKDVTKQLLGVMDAGNVPPRLLQKAGAALVARQDPSALDLYVESLRVHPDFAEDKKPKRLDVFARIVAAMKAREAMAPLVEYLRLPDTDPEFVREIADAALAMEARESLDAFGDFLSQYRADPSFTGKPSALLAACEVLLKLGRPSDRTLLTFVANEPKTLEPVRAYLERVLAERVPATAAR